MHTSSRYRLIVQKLRIRNIKFLFKTDEIYNYYDGAYVGLSPPPPP